MNYTTIPTESDEQQSLFKCLKFELGAYPDLKMMFHVPNEGKRTQSSGGRLKSEGLRKGVPDLILDTPIGKYHGLRIELKRRQHSKISKEQKEWIINLQDKGYAAAFCYGWEEAWQFIEAYLNSQQKMIDNYINRSRYEAEKE